MNDRNTDSIRADQQAEGRAREGTLHLGTERRGAKEFRHYTRDNKPPRRHTPKGHDAILADLQERRAEVKIVTVCGAHYTGRIVGRDKFTITVERTHGLLGTKDTETMGDAPVTIYKSAISTFQPTGLTVREPMREAA